MSLVLSLQENQDFYAGDARFVVKTIKNPTEFVLVDDAGQEFEITSLRGVEIAEEVYASAGHNPASSTVRVALSAPRSIIILRGEKRRQLENNQCE